MWRNHQGPLQHLWPEAIDNFNLLLISCNCVGSYSSTLKSSLWHISCIWKYLLHVSELVLFL